MSRRQILEATKAEVLRLSREGRNLDFIEAVLDGVMMSDGSAITRADIGAVIDGSSATRIEAHGEAW